MVADSLLAEITYQSQGTKKVSQPSVKSQTKGV